MKIASSLVALALVAASIPPAIAQPGGVATAFSGIDLTSFDPSVRPQDDFFHHVNGSWIKSATLPADKSSVGVFDQMNDATQDKLRGLIELAARNAKDIDARKVGDLYASFMDEPRLETLGAKPVVGELKAIDAVRDSAQLGATFARFERIGVESPLTVYIGQDDRDSTRYLPTLSQAGLGLPDRDYYLNADDTTFAQVRAKYVDYLATLLGLAGGTDTRAAAESVLALETEIARLQWTRVELRDPVKTYNKVTIATLPSLSPGYPWADFMAAAGLAGPKLGVDKVAEVVVGQPSYVTGLGGLMQSVPLATWKAYAKTQLLSAYAPYLDKTFVDASFAFKGTVIRGTTENQPRWKRGVRLVDDSIGEDLGKLYVAAYFPPENKAKMEALVGNLIAAYRQSITTLDWMVPETKQAAFAKLVGVDAILVDVCSAPSRS